MYEMKILRLPQLKGNLPRSCRKALSSVQLFLGALICLAQPLSASSSAEPSPIIELPITIIDSRVVVQASIAQYSLQLVLDTGASSSALFQSEDQDFAALEAIGHAQIIFPGLDEKVNGSKLQPVPIMLGTHQYIPRKLLRIERRPPVGDRLNFKFDGVLGQDFFSSYIVEIDPANSLLRLHENGTNLSLDFRTTLNLHMKGTSPHIQLSATLPWEKSSLKVTKSLLLDTGYPGTMVIWNKKHFRWANSQKGE